MVTISEKILSEEKIVSESILVARFIKKRFQHVCYFSNDILFTDLPTFS